MAAQIYKLWVKKVLWQSVILLLLHLQLYGIISIFKLHHAKENIRVLSHLSRMRSIVQNKTKYIKIFMDPFCRKNRQLVAKDARP